MNAQEVKQVWDSRAKDSALTKETITFNDYWYRMLEVEHILDYIKQNGPFKSVLDIGCGNGFTTEKIAKLVDKIRGVDYSGEMIHKAETDYGSGVNKNITWGVEDVISMDTYEKYDLVLSSRCLINLESWEDQKIALDNIACLVRPGGLFMMVECTKQGRNKLNDLREKVGLTRIPSIKFNQDFDDDLVWDYLSKIGFTIVNIDGFGLYEVISKVVHSLYVDPEEPSYYHKLNQVALKMAKALPNTFTQYSHEFVAVLRKK